MVDIEFDGATLLAALERLPAALSNFSPEVMAAAKLIAGQIDANFQHSRDLVDPLSDSTLKHRDSLIRKGANLVAERDTPLRETKDSIRKAAIALRGGTPGSIFAKRKNELTFGIDPDASAYMDAVLLGTRNGRIPGRDEVMTEGVDAVEEKAMELIQTAMEARARQVLMIGAV
jgi:hypothetical protein